MSLIPSEVIAQVQANDASLVNLNLGSNSLWTAAADDFTTQLANGLKSNTHLKELKLSGNGISTSGASALAEALKVNHTLKKLDLENNKIDNDGLIAIANALKENKGLHEIVLLGQGREPGESALEVFIECFEYNTSMRNIVWRLNSRKSFTINARITRNNEIKRRLQAGKSVDDIDPNIRRATAEAVLAQRASGLPKFETPQAEEECTEAPPATGGPYTLKVLKGKMLPADVDPLRKEEYLSDDEFKEVFGESRDSYNSSPTWKRKNKKQSLGLF